MKKTLFAAALAVGAFAVVSPAAQAATEDQTIVEVASANPEFSTLVAALTAANLTAPFDSCDDADTTVFAPTNAAFAAALTALGLTAEQLLADTATLTSVLTYHVVPGAVNAATVVTLDSATTLNGADIAIDVVNGGVVLNGTVNVVTTDIVTCNGIIHVIDAVLLPPAPEAIPNTGSTSTSMVAIAGVSLLGGLGLMGIARRRTVRA
jgi:transforming growth factor-beta-induced protein